MNISTSTYILPSYWVSPLLYGDETGLSDDELDELYAWINEARPGLCVDVTDCPGFTAYHDAKGLGVLPCECATYIFQHV